MNVTMRSLGLAYNRTVPRLFVGHVLRTKLAATAARQQAT